MRYCDLTYDLFAQDNSQTTEFFRKLFAENQVRRVLDCACGTGRHLPMFNSLGMDVTGSDISPSMLGQARKNLARLGLTIQGLGRRTFGFFERRTGKASKRGQIYKDRFLLFV